MDVYRTDRVRNVVLLGHGGAGKTTLAEAMAYHTPGYFDFVGEVEEAVGVADAAIIVVSGKDGVQVGTEKAWELCEEHNLPRMIFVTEMDNDDVSYREVVEKLQELFGKKIAPLHMPIRENGKFVGYVNIVKKAGRHYIAKGRKEECPVPDYLKEYLDKYRETLLESVAETSDEYMDRYFSGDEFSVAEISAALATNIDACAIVPVCMGSPVNLQGVSNLLDDICEYFPDPSKRPCTGINTKTNEIFEANYDFQKAKSAYVWKTISDPFIGKYSLIKVCSGTLKSDDTLFDVDKGNEERLFAGDIGALAKLGDVSTGDSLATKQTMVSYPKTLLSVPYTAKRYKAVNKGDDDKIAQALAKLAIEDRTFHNVIDSANHQSLLYGIGDQQIEVIKSKLEDRYKVKIELCEPKVAFRETIRKKSDVEGKYKKQTGGHGQYGDVKMRFEPSGNMDKPYEFVIEVVGGAVPKNYYPAVEKGLAECMDAGPLAGYPVVGVRATLYDGSYHPVDSSEQAFKTATHMAFKDGFMKADPVLLEPIVTLRVKVKDQYTGDVMGDLNKRRGRVLGMNPDKNGTTIIEADVPQTEIYGYGTVLRSMTGGSGDFSYEFARYEQAPADVQKKQIEARADKVGRDEE